MVIKEELDLIAQTIFDKKGFNIVAIDVRDVSTMVDYFVFAEGNVDRHVNTIAGEIIDVMSKEGVKPLRIDGESVGDWVVIDFGDIFVHLFTPEMREKYRLENMWHEGKIVDLTIDVGPGSKE